MIRTSVIGALTAITAFVIVFFGGTWLFFSSHGSQITPQTTCANHLRQLGGILTVESMEHGYPETGGVPLLIEYCRRGFIQRGREEILTCPGDPDVGVPPPGVVDTVDVTDAKALGHLSSYAVRDFARYPLDEESETAQWIMCDRQGADGRTDHHHDGINVLFDDGAVQFRDREALGLSPDEPIIVGPDSPHAELRKMAIVPVE
jgi:hypothetical protein